MKRKNIVRRISIISLCFAFLMAMMAGCQNETKTSSSGATASLSSEIADNSGASAQSSAASQIGGSSQMNISAASNNPNNSNASSAASKGTVSAPPSASTASTNQSSALSDSVFAERLASEKQKLNNIASSQPAFTAADSLDGMGDYARIANVMRKAKRGEKVTIGILGDSISQGAGANPAFNAYAAQVNTWWGNVFGYENVNYVNASIGSNTLTNIVHRMDDDLLSHNPDLVVFSAWSFHDPTNDSIAMESTIKRMLDKNIAVIVLVLTDTNGGNNHNTLAPIAQHYQVPVVSFAKAYANSGISWGTIGADSIHPNNTGHSLIALCVNTLFTNIGNNLKIFGTSPSALPSSAYQPNGLRYVNATIWDRNDSGKITLKERGSFVNEDKMMTSFRTYKGWKANNSRLVCELPKISSLHLMFCHFSGGGTVYVTVTTQSGIELCKDTAVNTNASHQTGYSWNSKLFAANINEPVTVSIRGDGGIWLLGFMVT